MTTQSLILPYERTAIRIPRRDLVLSSADSLTLSVTVVESDDPDAGVVELTGGIGGPGVRFNVWAHHDIGGWGGPDSGWWDYGRPSTTNGYLLGSFDGTISTTTAGTFDFFFQTGTMTGWPRRCAWSIDLTFDSGRQFEMLSSGSLHVRWSKYTVATPTVLLVDDTPPASPPVEGDVSEFIPLLWGV